MNQARQSFHFPPNQAPKVDGLAARVLELESQIDSNIPTTLWISDLHGEGDRFKSILKGRFGMLYQSLKEALPQLDELKIQYLAKLVRKRVYFYSSAADMDLGEVISCLSTTIKHKLDNVHYDFKRITLPEFRPYIQRLISDLSLPESLLNNPVIANRLITHLCHTIKQVLLDQIIVLGDIWDRGSQPDKIIRILSSNQFEPIVQLVYGNHDILWMGAAAGAESLVIEAMRITCRYDHFEMMERMDFDFSKLEAFACKTYPPELATGKFKAKTDKGRSMEKALAVIQFKLEDALIKRRPEYALESRLSVQLLAEILKKGETASINDTHFPTLDLDDPAKLTTEEAEIIQDLKKQFANNRKLKRLMRFFFEKGKTYHIHNNLLNIHALVPTTVEGEFESFLGHKGKALLDFIQESVFRAGQAYLKGEEPLAEDRDLFFYLWCGPKSPFFGKHAMKTLERYFMTDKESHKEISLHWKENLQKGDFKSKLLLEFNAMRVIYGHTPVDVTKGKRMASDDGIAINVDGGFAAAYYNRGHALVQTPHQLYGIILPTPDEMKEAELTHNSIPLAVELIDEFERPIRIKDTFRGQQLQKELQELNHELERLVERQ